MQPDPSFFCPSVCDGTEPGLSDPKLSLFLLALCYQSVVAFRQPKNFVVPVFPERFRLVTFFEGMALDHPELFGYILESHTKVIVVFRGTVTYGDAMMDLNIRLVPFNLVSGAGNVHEGFRTVYTQIGKGQKESARKKILRTLNSLDSRKSLYITGHSLGGALATLCALDVAANTKWKNPMVQTSGSPRVGDAAFVRKFNKMIRRSVRLVNYYDYITLLPPDFMGYKAVKQKVQIRVPTGRSDTDHTCAYFRGVAEMVPWFAKELCTRNPKGFCRPEFKVSWV